MFRLNLFDRRHYKKLLNTPNPNNCYSQPIK